MPFAPSDLYSGTNGVTFDFSDKSTMFTDTAGTTPVTTSGDLIARINDKYGNGINAIQATSGLRPIYTDSGGVAYADFSGGQYLKTAAFSAVAQPNFFAAAAKFDTLAAATTYAIADGGSTAQHLFFSDDIAGTHKLRLFAGTSVSDWGINTTTTAASFSGVFNGASSSVRQGGTTGGTFNPGASSLTAITVGAHAGGGNVLDGRVYAFVWAGINPTTTQRDDLHAWLDAKLVVGALTGATTLSFTPSATLTGTGALTGATTLSFAPSATLTGTGALSGPTTLSFAPSGTLTGSGALTGATTLSFTPSATLTGAGALTGASSLSFTPSGTLTGAAAGAMTGASSLSFTPSGTLTGRGALTGASTLTFAPAGTLSGTSAYDITATALPPPTDAIAVGESGTASAVPGMCLPVIGGIFDAAIFDSAIFDTEQTPVGSTALAIKER